MKFVDPRTHMRLALFGVSVCTLLLGCATNADEQDQATMPDSICTSLCNAAEVTTPYITDAGGYGNITSYGSVTDPQPSTGGACGYGESQVLNYAAAGNAFWNGGHICGQCVRIQTPSPTGFRSVVVRIVNQCPDDHCGIDLGGAPAHALMGYAPGRYAGMWKYVSCDGVDSVSDGSPSLFVKEGSNKWWALLQARNGPGATNSIRYEAIQSKMSGTFAWATEAENYFKVPDAVLADTGSYNLSIVFSEGTILHVVVKGTDLGFASSAFPLQH